MQWDLIFRGDLSDVAGVAQAAERIGWDGFRIPETRHDVFVALALASTATERIALGSSVAIALARNPMTLASGAYDLQRISGGRIELGLGTQIRPHITRRYGMPWSQPARRMRETVTAIRAIWSAWQTGQPLEFEGEFYQHTLMTPTFDPGPLPGLAPRITIAAVGPRMMSVAAEVGDGLICHPMTSLLYLDEMVLPVVEMHRGMRRTSEFEVSGQVLVATGRDDEELEQSLTLVRKQIAFYASTPAYKPVLDLHGFGDRHGQLNALSRQGLWDQMGHLVEDTMVDLFAVVGTPEEVGREISRRYGARFDRVSVTLPPGSDEATCTRLLAEARTLQCTGPSSGQ